MVGSRDEANAYWLRQLSEPPPCPNLPWDAEHPRVSSYVRGSLCTGIQSATWSALRELTAHLACRPQAALLAGLQVLLFRYTGQTDLIVGTAIEGGQPLEKQLVPLRMKLAGDWPAQELVLQTAAALREAAEHVPIGAGTDLREILWATNKQPTFNVALLFTDNDSILCSPSDASSGNALAGCAIVVHASVVKDGLRLDWEYDAEVLTETTVQRMAGHLDCLLGAMMAEPNTPVDRLNLLTAAELRQLLVQWNATETEVPSASCIHRQIETQTAKAPKALAVICRGHQLTYAELNARANQVASHLSKLGVGTEDVVGLCVERSLEMVVGLLGILKAGAAYLPLDPTYPSERLAFLVEDARPKLLLASESCVRFLPNSGAGLLCLDADWPAIAREPAENIGGNLPAEHLAYVLYTSGSTGQPKAVMVEHRNVLNFFAGMDACVPHGPGATWLAATSLSFDISVLELLWTLARGFKIVLYAGDGADHRSVSRYNRTADRRMDFSLFYFSSEQTDGPGGAYQLLTEGARFADERGFVAVWTPERHFHAFGGLYPNPAVTSAALATITKRVQIRAGSVVAPLHSPLRIAEEWAVVDNLSNGRAGISFASGWMPEDFALNPGNYRERKELMIRCIEIVRQLWRGESVLMPGALGKDVAVKVLPRPVQAELPLWLTAAGNPDTFQLAGRLGLNLLTHLLGQSLEDVGNKVALYRQAWREAGHAGRGQVTLMLHTFVGESIATVKATVREPLIGYLRQSADLIRGYTWAFSAFKHSPGSISDLDFSQLPKEEMDALLEHAFERYFSTSGLFGTPKSCLERIDELRAADVDETACLIDFGIDANVVLNHLEHLDELRRAVGNVPAIAPTDDSLPALIERHRVTHFQCTPSMASALLADARAEKAFGGLECLLIGGETFPATLGRQLRKMVRGDLLNMYGPTETTIWSSVYTVPSQPERIPVGRPIANTQMYVVDQNLLPVPVGIPGELLIGGNGVARGYLGRPELTAERFIRSKFPAKGTNRLYRTGDLARFLPDGNIELLGRLDHQVKIRGHRVELGEIEACLNEHPGVRESVLVAHETADGYKQLVAYVVPREGQKMAPSQLRQYTGQKLPEYMVPAKIVFLAALPQTPNHKIDRKALAKRETVEENESQFEPPGTALEQAVGEYWKELLKIPRAGRGDNFFEIGGDSLLAMHLAAWVREHYHVDLPLRALFEHPTLAGLAVEIEALQWSVSAAPAIEPAGEREEVEI